MKALKDTTLDIVEATALEGAKVLKAYFAYEGSNPSYVEKAKLGASAISGYARLRAGESNRMSVELSIAKFSGKKI